MGSVVKHVTGALTGHSGGGTTKTSSKETSNTNQSQESWLQKNPQYQALETKALQEAGDFNTPAYQLAGNNANITGALNSLAQGVNPNQYNTAANKMFQQGQTAYNTGAGTLAGATNTLSRLSNMTQSQYDQMLKGEYNSQLVNDQIDQMKGDVNQTYANQVQQLNQGANAAGAMGNSRAGVAQGVMAGEAQKAIASGSVQYRTAEETAAASRLSSYLGLQSSNANALASIGSNQQAMGLQQYGAGMGYYSQYNQAVTQNAQNRLTAGQAQRQYQQQQMDVARQNNILSASPSLQRLSYYNQSLLPMANLSTFGMASGTSNSSGTNTTPGQGGNLLGGIMGIGSTMYAQSHGYGDTATGAMGMLGSSFGNAF